MKKIKKTKTEVEEEKVKQQAEDLAEHIKPKTNCKKGCAGKGYSWDSVDGSIRICDCLFKSLKKVYTDYHHQNNAPHPLAMASPIVLKAWGRKHIRQSPNMAIIDAKNKGLMK